MTSLAEVLIKSGQVELAKEDCFAALDIVTELGDMLGVSAAYANLGMAERASGDMQASDRYYLESVESLEDMEVPRSMGIRKMEYGLMLMESGDGSRAKDMLKESRELLRSVDAKDLVSKIDDALKSVYAQEMRSQT